MQGPIRRNEDALSSPKQLVGEIKPPDTKQSDFPSQSTACKSEEASFADLIGVRSELLDWPKMWLFAASYLLSIISNRSFIRMHSVFEFLFNNSLFVFLVLSTFRKVRSTSMALIFVALIYTLSKGFLYSILFPAGFSLTLLPFFFMLIFTYLGGLCYSIQFVRPLWASLSLWSFAGSILTVLTLYLYLYLYQYQFSSRTSIQSLTVHYLQELFTRILFVFIFLTGLYLLRKHRSKRRIIAP